MMNILRKRASGYLRCYQSARVAEYIHDNCAGEAAEVLRQADMLLDNTFVFTDRWDMEPCAEPYKISLDSWVYTPNGDPEWVFMLNRHDFLNKLWQAWVLTGNRDYVRKLRQLLLDWIEKNPITPEGSDATRTIDTGIRCMNWITLLLRLLPTDILSDEDVERILTSLTQQVYNMHSRYIGKYALSNWGVLQTTAICACHAWLSERIPPAVGDWAWEELRLQLSLQILDDGSHWEQSAMYHVEVLNTCVRLLNHLRFAQASGAVLCCRAQEAISTGVSAGSEAQAGPGEGFSAENSGWLVQAIRVLSRHVLHSADPGFYQLPQCDSDVTDVRDVMARAAALLDGGGIYRFAAGEAMDMDSVWLLGWPGVEAFHLVKPEMPVLKSWPCADSGNFFFRSGWDPAASFTWLKNGTLGSSHGHADQTHLTLYHRGRPFLIDSGRYTYLEEDPLRTLLKKPCAHNVCVIDGQSGGAPNGSWSYHSYDETLKNYFREQDGCHYGEMPFHGVLSDGTPYLVVRKVLALDVGVWLSVQDVICQGTHTLREYFHLDSRVSVRQGREVVACSGDASLTFYFDGPVQCREAVVSSKYNEKELAPVLIRTTQMQDRATSWTLICDENYQINTVPVYQMRNPAPVSPKVAMAWDVEIPDGTQKTLILWNRETCRGDKLYTCHGRSVYGKAIVLDWREDGCRMLRLKT